MRTDQLIPILAANLLPQDRHAVLRRFCIALSVGAVAAVVALVSSLGIRPDLPGLLSTPFFWGKLAFPLLMAFAAVLVAARLAIPGASARRGWLLLIVFYAAMWVVALAVLVAAPPDARLALLFGHTWSTCPVYIALLSVPGYLALSWAMRGLAPTRPRLAGMAVGLLSGAIGTLAYILRCPEMSVPFWALWYSIGMAIPMLAGCLLARVSFRWC
jgi:hypothetical protein